MNDIPIEYLNRVDEWLVEQEFAELEKEIGEILCTEEALELAKQGNKTALTWLQLLLRAKPQYRRGWFSGKFPDEIIQELVDRFELAEFERGE